MKKTLRGFAAILISLLLISLLVETIEFLMVTAINGSVTSDPEVYFGVRNRPWPLAMKFLYTLGGGLAGGYAAAWLAGRAEIRHAVILAVVQAAALVWGMTASEYARSAPVWVWTMIIFAVTPAIICGGWLRARSLSRVKSAP